MEHTDRPKLVPILAGGQAYLGLHSCRSVFAAIRGKVNCSIGSSEEKYPWVS